MINTSVFQNKRAAYYTLGCKLNFSETSTFGQMLQELGVVAAKEGEKADLCLINTCSVTEVADHKCRQAINRMVRNNPGAFVAVTGCYAQLESERVSKIDGVDLVLGSNEKADLIQFLSDAWTAKESDAEHMQQTGQDSLHRYYSVKTKNIKSFAPSCSRGNRTRYFLKVQDGCDYYCTYCTIPYARGNSRNPTISSLVAQAEQAAAEGGKEPGLGKNRRDFISECWKIYDVRNGELVAVTDPTELASLNANASRPLPYYENNVVSSEFIESAAYLRLSNITVGYSLPKKWFKGVIERVRLYATMANVFCITGYSGYDPEVNTDASRNSNYPTPYMDYGAYVRPRTFTFGVNVKF